eukprot:g7326.t1
MRFVTALVAVLLFSAGGATTPTGVADDVADVLVYGATGAGCVAAIAASRSGAGHVVLLSQTGHVGGMLTGGLQHTDSANDTVIQGITREFFVRTEQQYPGRPTDANYPPGHGPPGWLFESHVGERVLQQMLDEANVTVVRNVVNVADVAMDGATMRSLTTEAVSLAARGPFAATVFVDGSYEGDLLDRAGCSMTWGREAAAQYGETAAGNGMATAQAAPVSPWVDAAATPLVPLPHVSDSPAGVVGSADRWIEPMTFRLCLTNSPGNRLPITKPARYDPAEFEMWRRIYARNPPNTLSKAGLNCLGPIPNNYTDCGAGGCKKCDMLGMNHGTDMTNGANGYPNGTTAERAAIWAAHIEFAQGLLWFWQTDPGVPKSVRDEVAGLGHCTDEYDADSNPPHWPHQLYVREAKRLVGEWVWTEFKPNATLLARSVGLGSYNFDSHYVRRYAGRSGGGDPAKDTIMREGRVKVQREQLPPGAPTPAPAPSPGASYGCVAQRCVQLGAGKGGLDAGCGGACAALAADEWLAVRKLALLSDGNSTLTVHLAGSTGPCGKGCTFLKKSEQISTELPDAMKKKVLDGAKYELARPATVLDGTYLLVALQPAPVHTSGCTVCMVEPFEMPYDSMLPKAAQATNLLGPVAVSATHVRYNAVRMEPTWMILGHAAGTAAAMAAKAGITAHDVDVLALQKLLRAQKQLISPTDPVSLE